MKEIYIKTPYIKLSAFLKFAGECGSGGQAKAMVLSGEIKVNGEVCPVNGKKLQSGDKVEVQGNKYTVLTDER